MKSIFGSWAGTVRWIAVGASYFAAVASTAVTIPNQPLTIQPSARPMIMLAMAKDHRLYYEAYNDASDIDGDGTLDIRFKPAITYLGLFNPSLCYQHNNDSTNTGLFTPTGPTGANNTCVNRWSGNFLNYLTTSRIDALRVVLYGGMREVDTTSSTILRRAYIPQDAHSWAKEYTSEAVDKYKISNYTPLSEPGASRRHFFGNFTPNAGVSCATIDGCSNLPPRLSVVTNSHRRVWEWASKERPVLNNNYLDNSQVVGTNIPTAALPTARTDLTVRVQVCTGAFIQGCKPYPGGTYKPTGLFHDYGESDAALFGLLTGSYDSHLSGGRLRKVMSSFKDEVDLNTGQFTNNATMVRTINALRIRGFNQSGTGNAYAGSVVGNAVQTQGVFPDWGNPLGEIMYEAVRYLGGRGAPTTDYVGTNTIDDQLGLPRPNWDNPWSQTSAAKAPTCAKANLLTISDTNISFDSNQLPGVNSNFSSGGGISTDLNGVNIFNNSSSILNVSNAANLISGVEPGIAGSRFIGQVGAVTDAAATAKNVTTLSNIRGLAPEEPTKQGSYYAASVAQFAKAHDLLPSLANRQNIDSFYVALASPLPRIEAKLPNGRVINVLPFAKSVGGFFSISNTKGQYQPTNQIVDFYVESIANSGPQDADASINNGRYQATFRINFEDVEQGNDHDMDAIVEYVVKANANNTLSIQLRTLYEAGSVNHRMGYIISGTTADGTYLVVQDSNDITPYFLSVPPGRAVGYCDQNVIPTDCGRLPFPGANASTTPTTSISSITFSASSAPPASYLRDPMWYAAKWGGFTDGNNNGVPDLAAEWDKDTDGQPDNYFFVQNPIKLKDSLKAAFDAILERFSSASNLATSSGQLDASTLIYRSSFLSGKWTGDIKAFSATTDLNTAPPIWSANDRLQPWNTRDIFMSTPNGLVNTRSTNFASLNTTTQASLVNNDIYEFIRGNRAKQISAGGTLRNRDDVLSDFIYSSPNMDTDYKTLYVGGNGGMLHAFNGTAAISGSGTGGRERFAVIPREVVPRLKALSDPGYVHQYYVDGQISLSRRFLSTNYTRYVLTQLGRGGKGLMLIKANYASPNENAASLAPNLLWEYTPSGATNMGTPTTAINDRDLGLMLSRADAARLNNGKYGFFVGNGYNSTDGKAVLYVFIINPDGSLDSVRKIDTGVAGDNGLAGPGFVDFDGDSRADAVYAGDLKGNVWKFDIKDTNPSNWKVAYGGEPMFKARSAGGVVQSITAPVYVDYDRVVGSPHYLKPFVFVGTGSYFKVGDNSDLSQQSFYAIIDNEDTSAPNPITARSQLRQRTITTSSTVAGRQVRAYSPAVTGDMAGRRGWYIDLPASQGERVVNRARIVQTRQPALVFTSIFPNISDPCEPSGDGWFHGVSPYTGGQLQFDLFDLNRDTRFNELDRIGSNFVSATRLSIGIPSEPVILSSSSRPINGSYCVSDCEIGRSGLDPDGTGKVDRKELDAECDGNACIPCVDPNNCKPPGPPTCADKIRAFNNGSEAVSILDLQGCVGGLKGRISWREIILN
jgi:type IV pilus assembly protein PilY1